MKKRKKLSAYLLRPSKCRLFAADCTLPGLIEFLFDLLDKYGVRMTLTLKASNLKEYITLYASSMLRDLFRTYNVSRDEILNQITERIFSSKVNKSIVFIDQLAILIMTQSASSFQDYFSKFKSKLDNMIYMTPIVALEFLSSIKPLLKFDSIYKDNLIITLKKSIYQSDLNVRKVGINGLICLLYTTKLASFTVKSSFSVINIITSNFMTMNVVAKLDFILLNLFLESISNENKLVTGKMFGKKLSGNIFKS